MNIKLSYRGETSEEEKKKSSSEGSGLKNKTSVTQRNKLGKD